MRIAFIVNNERYHNGGARPFFNWNRAISDSGLIRIGYSADSHAGRTESAANAKEAVSVVKDYDLIVVDDLNVSLGAFLKKNTGLPMAVYCQIPFGLHALGVRSTGSEFMRGMKYDLSRFVPFSILSRNFKSHLGFADLLLANGRAMGNILNYVYGFPRYETVYPPVDTEVFSAVSRNKLKKILLFKGREDDWNDFDVLPEISRISRDNGLEIETFGSANIPTEYRSAMKIRNNPELTDQELASLYSESLAVVAIQLQEFFGYVPVEALACGTPAVTLYDHDASALQDPSTEVIVKATKRTIGAKISSFLNTADENELYINARRISQRFSSRVSAEKLLRVVGNLLNE